MKSEKSSKNSNNTKMNPYLGFLWGILIVLLLNGLIFPNIARQQIKTTDYGDFIEKVENGIVKEVAIKNGQIYFTVEDKGKTTTYQTGETNDPQLVNRLLEAKSPNINHKISFNQIVPEENSPHFKFYFNVDSTWLNILYYLETSK